MLGYFESTKKLSIQCDASGKGLGAALLQEGRPLAYASRALSDTETRYATIEKDMLAIVFALEKWHQYTYGRHVTVHSDHKPLEIITKKPLDRVPKRLQGMLVRALAYDIDVQYLSGKEMFLADTLSRAYLPQTCEDAQEEFEIINALTYLVMSERAWEKIGCDLLSCRGKDYLINVCYKSNFWELDRLTDTKSTTVIKKLKARLARYGIPRQLVSGNGPQFVSSAFHTFTKSWSIEHTTTSPHHSKAKGKVESAVKVAKRMLRKTAKSGEDQYLALLNIRNAQTQGVDRSPSQRLMGRRTRTLLQAARSLLEPRNPLNPHEMEQLQLNQKRQAKYYNRTAHDLPTLREGNTVRMKPFVLGQHTWKKAAVTRRLDERSYEVQASGTTYRRNRQHLVKTSQPSEQQALAKEPHPVPSTDCKVTTTGQDTQHIASPQNQAEGKSDTTTLPSPCDSGAVKRSRSGRAIKSPARLKDYVLT